MSWHTPPDAKHRLHSSRCRHSRSFSSFFQPLMSLRTYSCVESVVARSKPSSADITGGDGLPNLLPFVLLYLRRTRYSTRSDLAPITIYLRFYDHHPNVGHGLTNFKRGSRDIVHEIFCHLYAYTSYLERH